jgi:4-amino-4-deoxy-L-arabinose transferase-like glycosyltransferase
MTEQLARWRRRSAEAAGWLGLHPLTCLTLILLAQVLPSLFTKDVWLPDEVRHAAVFQNLWQGGHWLVLHLGDAAYADKPPVYFWLVAAIVALVGSTAPFVFMAAAAVSAWALLAALVQAGWRLGLGPRVVLLSGLILLTCWFFIERAHQPRMDLLFATFILLAQTALYLATLGDTRLRRGPMAMAGLAMALAALTKGPLGVALPLVGFALFLLRQRRGRLLVSREAGLCLAVIFAFAVIYLAGVVAVEGWGFVHTVAIDQIWTRAVHSVDLSEPVYAYIPMLAGALLPWSLVLVWSIWRGVRRLGWTGLWTPSRGPNLALPYLWGCFLGSFVLISALDYKIAFLLVPLLAPIALILAHDIETAPSAHRRALFGAIAAAFGLAAVVTPFAPALTLWPDFVQGAWPVALGLVATAALGLMARNASGRRFGVHLALGITLTLLPLYQITMRGLNEVMSPRALGEVIGGYATRGYGVAEYDPAYTGHFDYHAGVMLQSLRAPADLSAFAASTDCGLVVMRRRLQDDWANPPALTVVTEAQLDASVYRVLVWTRGVCG